MTDLYLPAEQRREIIRQYGRDCGIRTFVETGTADGETVATVFTDFDLIYTIELDEYLHFQAIARFVDLPKVHCLLGDSGVILPHVVAELTEPALFWLDGHYCGGARGDIDTPIVAELEAALKAPAGSVILIDDARLFGGGKEHTEEFFDYPDVSWVAQTAGNHGFSFELKDDIMRLT